MKQVNSKQCKGRAVKARQSGFSLVELLTVISIIGLIAGLVVGVGPAVQRKMREARVKSDLSQIVTAIENYKAKFGVYPPDNQTPIVDSQSHLPFPNQLFYELTGCVYSKNTFECLFNNKVLSSADLRTALATDGIQNSSDTRNDVRNYFKELKASQVGIYTNNNVPLSVLVVPFPGPDGTPNYWKYVSKNPTNNPTTFDLWAEIKIGKEIKTIGNWQQ